MENELPADVFSTQDQLSDAWLEFILARIAAFEPTFDRTDIEKYLCEWGLAAFDRTDIRVHQQYLVAAALLQDMTTLYARRWSGRASMEPFPMRSQSEPPTSTIPISSGE
jgi:hypothetical protein